MNNEGGSANPPHSPTAYGVFFFPTPNRNSISDLTNSKIDLTLLIRFLFLITD